MPDTSIDLSEGIQSVRLKVPTAVVPIPPEGFAQLHSPAPGALALRLPDGSVVPVGSGGGGGGPTVSLTEQSAAPGGVSGVVQLYADEDEQVHGVQSDGTDALLLKSALGAQLVLALQATLSNGGDALIDLDAARVFLGKALIALTLADDGLRVDTGGGVRFAVLGDIATLGDPEGGYRVEFTPGQAALVGVNGSVQVNVSGVNIAIGSGHDLVISGLPAADPGVAGRCWRDPITQALMVSDGP